jgi:hypothetical protein
MVNVLGHENNNLDNLLSYLTILLFKIEMGVMLCCVALRIRKLKTMTKPI